MSNKFTRNITGVRDIDIQPFNTNDPLDLLLDVNNNAYVRINEAYWPIAGEAMADAIYFLINNDDELKQLIKDIANEGGTD